MQTILLVYMSLYHLSSYDYSLPDELIAQEPILPQHNARMCVVSRDSWEILTDACFYDLPKFLDPDAVIFFNNSKVLASRIPFEDLTLSVWDHTIQASEWELFFLRMHAWNRFESLVRPGKKFPIGARFSLAGMDLEVVDTTDSGRLIQIHSWDIFEAMNQYGQLPLPPYIAYQKEKEKEYQTVFASSLGSVAAPTASLHFTNDLLEKLPNTKEFVTLHVWLGTFKWVQEEDIRDYQIHGEPIEIEKDIFRRIALYKNASKLLVAVGTTVCRTLESLPFLWILLSDEDKSLYPMDVQDFWNRLVEGYSSEFVTSYIANDASFIFESFLYITPGKTFFLVDELITNFHLPRTSLLILVSAFLWKDETKKVYHHAINEKYRFFSFWDGMYIKKGHRKEAI